MTVKVLILRGLPGSGKSFFSAKMKRVSADDYMVDKQGNYAFDPSMLDHAHATCFRVFLSFLARHHDSYEQVEIAVDNTNLTARDIAPYRLAAMAHRCEYAILNIKCDPEVAYSRQTHGVSRATFDRLVRTLASERLSPHWKVVDVVSKS